METREGLISVELEALHMICCLKWGWGCYGHETLMWKSKRNSLKTQILGIVSLLSCKSKQEAETVTYTKQIIHRQLSTKGQLSIYGEERSKHRIRRKIKSSRCRFLSWIKTSCHAIQAVKVWRANTALSKKEGNAIASFDDESQEL